MLLIHDKIVLFVMVPVNKCHVNKNINLKMMFSFQQIVNEQPVVLKSTQDAVIALRLTVPFGCQANTVQCSLDVNVFMPRSDRCEIADVGMQQNILNPCGVRFFNNETDVTKSIRLQTIIAPRIAPQRRIIKARLLTQRTYNAHPIFGGYHVKSVNVSI